MRLKVGIIAESSSCRSTIDELTLRAQEIDPFLSFSFEDLEGVEVIAVFSEGGFIAEKIPAGIPAIPVSIGGIGSITRAIEFARDYSKACFPWYIDKVGRRTVERLVALLRVVGAVQKLKQPFYAVNYGKHGLLAGVDVKQVPLDDLLLAYEEASIQEAEHIAETWKAQAMGVLEVTWDLMVKSARAYIALKALLDKPLLGAHIECSRELIESMGVAPCLPVAVLNEEGIPVGCGDEALASLLLSIASNLRGRPCWMAHISSVDFDKRQLIVSHCTIPTSLVGGLEFSVLRTHAKHGLGISPTGDIRLGKVTVISPSYHGEVVLAEGKMIQSNMMFTELCRAQAVISVSCPVELLLMHEPLKHIILASGNIKPGLSLILKRLHLPSAEL
ncbi:MAG: hypothetical protein DRN99_00440 [Thermoproteota archaeon]|nr:MAG: hypothetical protein DRN99_00440 [Candidatus Korarchaeota archaeon]